MGDVGPCGACSEIHMDLRPDSERSKIDGKSLVNEDDPQVIELWNLVFMEFERVWLPRGNQRHLLVLEKEGVSDEEIENSRIDNTGLEELPAKHVDTGMGLERVVRAIKLQTSNYDTDLFMDSIKNLEQISGKSYGKDEQTDIAFRVIADHLRALSFCIADGQLPSNTGAGYVLRRILRRAVRYGYSFLGFNEPFLNKMVNQLADQFKGVFDELSEQRDFVVKVIEQEEVSFYKTLIEGIKKFNEQVSIHDRVGTPFAKKIWLYLGMNGIKYESLPLAGMQYVNKLYLPDYKIAIDLYPDIIPGPEVKGLKQTAPISLMRNDKQIDVEAHSILEGQKS